MFCGTNAAYIPQFIPFEQCRSQPSWKLLYRWWKPLAAFGDLFQTTNELCMQGVVEPSSKRSNPPPLPTFRWKTLSPGFRARRAKGSGASAFLSPANAVATSWKTSA